MDEGVGSEMFFFKRKLFCVRCLGFRLGTDVEVFLKEPRTSRVPSPSLSSCLHFDMICM